MAKGAATVIELRTAVATLKRAQESMKRRHREQAHNIAILFDRVALLERQSDEPVEFGDLYRQFVCTTPSRRNPLPKTDSTAVPPAASGASRDSSRRLFFDWIFGRKAK